MGNIKTKLVSAHTFGSSRKGMLNIPSIGKLLIRDPHMIVVQIGVTFV